MSVYLSTKRRLTHQSGPIPSVFDTFDFQMCLAPQRPALFWHQDDISTSKVVRARCDLYILTWKCASRHDSMHFFDISTSKSGPSMVCFVHFDLKMCFAEQLRALFQHLNFQRWSKSGVLWTFWLENVLRVAKARTFSTSQLAKVVTTTFRL